VAAIRRALVFPLAMLLSLTVPGAAAAQEPIQLVYAYWGDVSVERPVVELFEAAHPDIKIELLSLGGGTIGSAEKLLVMAAGGVLPDMFSLSGTQGVPPIFMDANRQISLSGCSPASASSRLRRALLWAVSAARAFSYAGHRRLVTRV